MKRMQIVVSHRGEKFYSKVEEYTEDEIEETLDFLENVARGRAEYVALDGMDGSKIYFGREIMAQSIFTFESTLLPLTKAQEE